MTQLIQHARIIDHAQLISHSTDHVQQDAASWMLLPSISGKFFLIVLMLWLVSSYACEYKYRICKKPMLQSYVRVCDKVY